MHGLRDVGSGERGETVSLLSRVKRDHVSWKTTFIRGTGSAAQPTDHSLAEEGGLSSLVVGEGLKRLAELADRFARCFVNLHPRPGAASHHQQQQMLALS